MQLRNVFSLPLIMGAFALTASALPLEQRSTVDLGIAQVGADVKTGIPPVDDIIAGLPDISVPELLKKLPELCVSDITGKLPELPVVGDVIKALPDVCLDKLLQKVPLNEKQLDKRHAKELAPSEAADISAKAIAEIQAILKTDISAKVAASVRILA